MLNQSLQLSSIERLSIFNLEPLELRRLCNDLVQYYTLLDNIIPFNPADYLTNCIIHYHTPMIVKPIRFTILQTIQSIQFLLRTN